MKKKFKKPTIDIGWREWISLVDFKDFYLKAKIDTGATISALHATHIEEFNFRGDKYVKFRLYQSKSYKMIKKPVIGYKMIKNSFGKKQLRPLINISIKIGNNTYIVSFKNFFFNKINKIFKVIDIIIIIFYD